MDTPEELVILGKFGHFWPIAGQSCYIKKKGGKILHPHPDSSVEVAGAVYYGGRELFEKNIGLYLPLAQPFFYNHHVENDIYWTGYYGDNRFLIDKPTCPNGQWTIDSNGNVASSTNPQANEIVFIKKQDAWAEVLKKPLEKRVRWVETFDFAHGMIQGSHGMMVKPKTDEAEPEEPLPQGVVRPPDGFSFVHMESAIRDHLGGKRTEMAVLPKAAKEIGWMKCDNTTVDINVFHFALPNNHSALAIQKKKKPTLDLPGLNHFHIPGSKYSTRTALPSEEEMSSAKTGKPKPTKAKVVPPEETVPF